MNGATPAEIFMGLGGKTFNLVGLGFVAVGGLYTFNRMSTSAIRTFESIPYWLGMKELKQEEKDKAVISKEDVKKGITAYGALVVIIIAGGVMGIFGRYISANSTITAANRFLYRVDTPMIQ